MHGALAENMNSYPAPLHSAPLRPSAPTSNPAHAAPDRTLRNASITSSVAYISPAATMPHPHLPHEAAIHPHRHHHLPDHTWATHHEHVKAPIPPHPQSHMTHEHPQPQQGHQAEPSLHPLHQHRHHQQPHPHHRPRQQHSHEPSPHQLRPDPYQLHHVHDPMPEKHHYQPINVVPQPSPEHRQMTTSHYVYPLHHQVMAPVAHVPIGAAHYAHLPPSIWTPAHTQYQIPPAPHHQQSVSHRIDPAPVPTHIHTQHPHRQTHVHHMTTSQQPHVYTVPSSQPAPPSQHHPLHTTAHHPHHVSYSYTSVPSGLKPPVAVSVSQPRVTPTPISYSVQPFPVASVAQQKTSSQPSPKCEPVSEPRASPPRALESNATRRTKSEQRVRQASLPQLPQKPEPQPLRNRDGTLRDPPAKSASSPHIAHAGAKIESHRSQGSTAQRRQKSQSTSGQPMRKPRKPYTITKSREVWTQEEHTRFLQALQLYDRDWKKIEAYIRTKTVLQIRSHAQKHFGKVAKYNTGEYIPPPRPKKRAALPYPRSRSCLQGKPGIGQNGLGSDSGAGSDNGALSCSGSAAGGGNVTTGGNSSDTLAGLRRSSTPTSQAARGNAEVRNMLGVQQQDPQKSKSGGDDRKESVRAPKVQSNGPLRNAMQGEDVSHLQDEPESQPEQSCVLPSGWKSPQSQQQNNVENRHPDNHGKGNCISSPDVQSHTCAMPDLPAAHGRENIEAQKTAARCESLKSTPIRQSRGEAEGDCDSNSQARKERIQGLNNSLLVLSNCVDMVSRDSIPDREPAAGWASAAAARRAHRAKVIRARKSPLPSGSQTDGDESPDVNIRSGIVTSAPAGQDHSASPSRRSHEDETVTKTVTGSHCKTPASQAHPAPSGNRRSRSPPIAQVEDENADGRNLNSQRNPPRSASGSESGSGSDDAIAGLSGCDRPRVSDMAAGLSSSGSGTGGSLENSDAGDTEEDPKSSNDGSGDDGNRLSPSTRDSSPTDPNSSGSRENSPNSNNAPGNEQRCLPESQPEVNEILRPEVVKSSGQPSYPRPILNQPSEHCQYLQNGQSEKRRDLNYGLQSGQQGTSLLSRESLQISGKLAEHEKDNVGDCAIERKQDRKRPRSPHAGLVGDGYGAGEEGLEPKKRNFSRTNGPSLISVGYENADTPRISGTFEGKGSPKR